MKLFPQKIGWWALICLALIGVTSCDRTSTADARGDRKDGKSSRQGQVANVDVAIAQTGQLSAPRVYTGTTAPQQQVNLRARVEGQLEELNVDVGDRVRQGQVLARLDDTLLEIPVLRAEAELAAQGATVARLQTALQETRTRIESARLEWQQAQADALRLERLQREGAVPDQAAEQARTTARTAQQTLQAAEAQLQTQQREITASQKQEEVQRVALTQVKALRDYAILTAPMAGTILTRSVDPGDLIESGDEILQLGDFQAVLVMVDIPEQDLRAIALGQTMAVRLDAFPGESWTGTVHRIAPQADGTSRLTPVEIILPNPDGKIGAGLLARVQVAMEPTQVIIPELALQVGDAQVDKQTLFVVAPGQERPRVQARPVQLGRQQGGNVEVIAGLSPGEALVVRSSQPLQDGAVVKPSILSEISNPKTPPGKGEPPTHQRQRP